ncbi:MAG: hypothetical protein AAF702_30525, partial [Chloroflexota bacterium]
MKWNRTLEFVPQNKKAPLTDSLTIQQFTNSLLSRSIRQEMAVMFSVFKLKDHKEKSETALVIRESADFIGFGTKMP